jgi:hypothetical protein
MFPVHFGDSPKTCFKQHKSEIDISLVKIFRFTDFDTEKGRFLWLVVQVPLRIAEIKDLKHVIRKGDPAFNIPPVKGCYHVPHVFMVYGLSLFYASG